MPMTPETKTTAATLRESLKQLRKERQDLKQDSKQRLLDCKETALQAIDTARHDAYVRGVQDAMALFEKACAVQRNAIFHSESVASKQVMAELTPAQKTLKKGPKKSKKAPTRTAKQRDVAANDVMAIAGA